MARWFVCATRDSLLEETCRLAVNVGEYVLATVWLIEAGGRTIRSVVTAGACEAEFTGVSMPFAGADGADPNLMARAILTQQAAVAPDISDPHRPGVAPRHVARGPVCADSLRCRFSSTGLLSVRWCSAPAQ